MIKEFITGLGWFTFTGLVLLMVFWIYQFCTMILSKKIRPTEKGIWFVLFLMGTFLTAVSWAVVKHIRR